MPRAIGLLVLLILSAVGAAAQVNVRGQFILPQGDLPKEPIRFLLQSDDALLNDYQFSDSNGRFILPRLDRCCYTITVESDGSTYGRTVYEFRPQFQQVIRVILTPLVREVKKTSPTVSAASARRPNPEAEKLYKAAQKKIENEDLDAAAELLRQAIAADAQFFDALNELAVILLLEQDYAEAEAVLRQALKADPKAPVALLNLGRALNHQKKYADAIPFLREALRLQPGLVAAHLHLGMALVETDVYAEAERELKMAIRKPGEEEIAAQLYLGKLYALTGKFNEGIAALETYLQKNPGAPNIKEVRELIERMKGELAKRR